MKTSAFGKTKRSHAAWVLCSAGLLVSCKGDGGAPEAPPFYLGEPSAVTGQYDGGLQNVTPAATGPFADTYHGGVAPDGTGYFASQEAVVVIPGLTGIGDGETTTTFLAADPARPSALTGTPKAIVAGAMPPVTLDSHIHMVTGTGPCTLPGICVSIGWPTIAPSPIDLSLDGYLGASKSVPLLPSSNTLALHGYYFGGMTSVSLSITPDGRVTGDDGTGCHIDGKLMRVGNRDLFQFSAAITGPSSCPGGVYGVAWTVFDIDWANKFSGASGGYVYVVAADVAGTKAFAVELMQ